VTSGTALYTDHYELTMLQAALRSGAARRRAVFEVFGRALPGGRRYGVVGGVGRLVEAIMRFRFAAEQLDFLSSSGVVDDRTCEWLSSYRFTGDVDGYPEGETYFPHSPVLVVSGTFGEAVLLETLVLSVLNHDSAIATAAARMVGAAGPDRPCIEMGSRRTHEEAAVAAARAAYVAGFAATSNLEAGRRWGVPTAGTSAHAFTLVHADERAAFDAQIASMGRDTTLLVDTYSIEQGIRTAIAAAGPGLGAIRLDSGDLLAQAWRARALLDELGAEKTRIIVTSDLDEHSIAALASAPVNAYGVGTSLVTGSGVPTAQFVYKLVARAASDDPDAPCEPVEKRSVGKGSIGGRKWATREVDESGTAVREVVYVGDPPAPRAGHRSLHVPLVRAGEPADVATVTEARERCARSRAELPDRALALSHGDPALNIRYERGGA
jgi:nicotinate phosphoribosyltransferase